MTEQKYYREVGEAPIVKDDPRNLGDLKIETISEGVEGAGVTIDGVLLKDGTITTTGPEIKSVDKDVVAHAGGTKAGAIADAAATITEQINIIKTCASDGDSVVLPAAVVGMEVKIANLTTHIAYLYAAGTDTIDDLVTANPILMLPEAVVTFSCYDTGKWQSDAEAEMALDISAGVSGAAGTVNIYPSTALKGRTRISTTDQTGDTIVDVVVGAMAAARTITLRDPGAAASFLTTTDSTAAATGATALEITRACDVSAANEDVTSANVLAATEDKKVCFLNLAAGFQSTLPAVALGLRFRFIVKTAPTAGSYTIVKTDGKFYGCISSPDLDAAGDAAKPSNNDTMTFVQNKALPGDWIECFSDGTNWFVSGCCTAFDAITAS